ncbi:MAG: STAS domain-containing protein [Streptosporangiaceae bacterium]
MTEDAPGRGQPRRRGGHSPRAGQRRAGRRYPRLDLSAVTFCDAAGLGLLMAAHHRFLAERGTLTLIEAPARIARLLQITALDRVLLPPSRPTISPLVRSAGLPSAR